MVGRGRLERIEEVRRRQDVGPFVLRLLRGRLLRGGRLLLGFGLADGGRGLRRGGRRLVRPCLAHARRGEAPLLGRPARLLLRLRARTGSRLRTLLRGLLRGLLLGADALLLGLALALRLLSDLAGDLVLLLRLLVLGRAGLCAAGVEAGFAADGPAGEEGEEGRYVLRAYGGDEGRRHEEEEYDACADVGYEREQHLPREQEARYPALVHVPEVALERGDAGGVRLDDVQQAREAHDEAPRPQRPEARAEGVPGREADSVHDAHDGDDPRGESEEGVGGVREPVADGAEPVDARLHRGLERRHRVPVVGEERGEREEREREQDPACEASFGVAAFAVRCLLL